MNRRHSTCWTAFVVAMALLIPACHSKEPPRTTPAALLAVEPPVHDLSGTITPEGRDVAVEFAVRNIHTEPVTIESLESSCGCAPAELLDGLSLPLVLPPGGMARCRFQTVASASEAVRRLTLTVYARSNGLTGEARGELLLNVSRPVLAQPRALLLGQLSAGETIKRRIYLGGAIHCEVPAVKSVSSSLPEVVQVGWRRADEAELRAEGAPERTAYVIDVTVTVPAGAKAVSEQLSVTLGDGRELTIPVSGIILRPFEFTPDALTINLAPTQQASRRVLYRYRRPECQELAVTAAPEWVEVRITDTQPGLKTLQIVAHAGDRPSGRSGYIELAVGADRSPVRVPVCLEPPTGGAP